MKKLFILLALSVLGLKMQAQATASIAIQYYVDGNSNCTFDIGEQIVYNVPTSIIFSVTSGTVMTSTNSPSFTSCSGQTLYCWNVTSPAVNTIVPMAGGITKNPCGNFNNVPYNTNTTQYLPVIVSSTSNLGVQMNTLNYFSIGGGATWQNVASGGTISLCSNFGLDSLYMNMNVYNLLSCNNTNTLAPRSYSFYLDNVMYDRFNVNGGLNSNTYTTGINNMVSAWEYYGSGNTYLSLYPDLPATFSVMGTHTFEVRSSMIYNNAASTINYVCYINSIPCAKISGRFYNDCNNNCTFDAGDSYGVGQYATGKIYNSSGVNITFNPNPWDGKFSIFMPATSAYSLTQFPTTTPGNFTACTTGTTTIPAAAATNTFLFGYRNNMPANADPGVYLYRAASTTQTISPLVGITFAYQFNNYLWNLCTSSSVVNPGKLKITMPKFINYLSTLSGPTPTLSPGATVDTLIYTIPNFSNTSNWFTTPAGTFSAVVSATAVANTPFNITAYIYPTIDLNLQNNVYSWSRIIGGPFDPNGKYTQVSNMFPNGDIPFGTQTFVYEIGFQNIGNAPAINVTTLDTIDNNFNLGSLRVLQSSFPVSLQTDNVSRTIGFHFKGINLPGAVVNEPASHGFVRYSINLKAGVPANTVLKNRAHNYFDFLEPVATNQTTNKLVVATAIKENGSIDNLIQALPNPFGSSVKINSAKELKNLRVFSLTGSLILNLDTWGHQADLDMQQLPAGVYIVRATTTDDAVSSIKIIKE